MLSLQSCMKYILLISMFIYAFSPKGLCTETECCQDHDHSEILMSHKMDMEDCTMECCTPSPDNDKDSQSQSTTHQCNCCLTLVTIDFNDYEEYEHVIVSQAINTSTKKLTSFYSFSIWIPPNKTA